MENSLNYKLLLEQYTTPVDITLEIIKQANSLGHLSGTVADFGCGTGRLAIGAAILGAKVTGYEIDDEALDNMDVAVEQVGLGSQVLATAANLQLEQDKKHSNDK